MSINPLPAGTTLGQSFEYGFDINLGTFGAPNWQEVRRMSGWAPTFPKVTQDAATYDDQGSPNEEVSGRGFAGAFTVQANRSQTTGLYLPEVEALVNASRRDREQAVIDGRFYHKPKAGAPHPTDAGRVLATVELSRQNTGNAEIDIFAISLTGKGAYTPIPNPYAGGGIDIAPAISAISPSGAAATKLVTITGVGFLGATDVKFGATSATAYTVISEATIVATVPAGTAGPVNVTVVTPVGTSATFAYTRGA
ncbi:IPT/TIG domain-containing protein [Microbacterium sp. STF-2]|uniref:IPT/TIG domain-containing protein n=1 Tax=Microbacterium sp. STF-2 TaxID=3031132 RepID=UPI002AFFB015|nr:IPT/TIG domain-containing protein [Microbacterium sp. STF-2]MEA1264158.1 IPT/TIG domain-containing protein [Microbacterium sp. STF-2]